MKDIYKNVTKGHLIVECLDSNKNIIDRYENKNLIMNTSRVAMAEIICGLGTSDPISKFVLGTEGHVTGDYLTPKTEANGFVSSRTELFSEELISFNYPIEFTNPGVSAGPCAIVSEPGNGSLVSLLHTGTDVQYTIEIPELTANNTGVVVYTEAALYAGENIFSMKCFPGKIKDQTVSLKIVWKILL